MDVRFEGLAVDANGRFPGETYLGPRRQAGEQSGYTELETLA
ncbi:MAG: hypothetical protein ACR2GU_09455 [Rubrobacteraceae bacterium]